MKLFNVPLPKNSLTAPKEARDRVKPMRGFGNAETAEIMTSAFRNYYNFIKPHNSIGGSTPAEMAGIGVENSENKWEELLKRSFDVKA